LKTKENPEISEIIETLEKLEQSLIDYEDSIQNNIENTSLIHIIFRYAHNLKSSLTMIGKHHSSEVIHMVESNFDKIRSGQASSSLELIDNCLSAIDRIRLNLYMENEESRELDKLKDKLKENKEKVKNKTNYVDVSFPLSEEEMLLFKKSQNKRLNIFQIEKMIKTDISEDSFLHLPIYKDIDRIGFHISTYPKYQNINKKQEEDVIKILFATEKTEEELHYLIFDTIRPVRPDALDMQELLKQKGKKKLRILIVEDEFTTRHLESSILSEFGLCQTAVDGKEAIFAYEQALKNNSPYDLIILDIMIPEIDGHKVLKRIRKLEEQGDSGFLEGVKIIITSCLEDSKNIMASFREQTDAYIIKPMTREKILPELNKLGLLK
jgi:two-component system chemotaxis response regulator CheY